MEHKTAWTGAHDMRRLRPNHGFQSPTAADQRIALARRLAGRIAAIIPSGFDRVLPRGYTVQDTALVIAKMEGAGSQSTTLYGRHNTWGEAECDAFLKDLTDGWLGELVAYMRWQLRATPEVCAAFQEALLMLTTNRGD